MKAIRFVVSTTVLLLGMSAAVLAADATPQQNKMTVCNKQAGEMKGDERKKFMSSCLKKDSSTSTGSQQDKMKDCNVAATGKKGDERKAFMSQCLKKSDS